MEEDHAKGAPSMTLACFCRTQADAPRRGVLDVLVEGHDGEGNTAAEEAQRWDGDAAAPTPPGSDDEADVTQPAPLDHEARAGPARQALPLRDVFDLPPDGGLAELVGEASSRATTFGYHHVGAADGASENGPFANPTRGLKSAQMLRTTIPSLLACAGIDTES